MKPFEPIAIVGRGCVLPGASDPAALWQAVAAGRDLITAAPDGRWGLARDLALTASPDDARDRAWSDRGGYVRGFEELFDAAGFALPPAEVLALDPLFRWVLHTAREALRDAGLDGDGDAERAARTGLVLGNLSFPAVRTNRFAESVWLAPFGDAAAEIALSDRAGDHRPHPRNRFMSGLPAHLAARALGLGGAAFALDAACASSLVAVKLACDRLHERRADVMLAGAVACADDLFIHIGFCALDALSKSGRSRPFHRAADGLLPAEGAAFVTLKRLADAIAGGDRIHGVIRGVGLANDGRGRGLLVPSQEGQVRAIRQAYTRAGLTPAEVSLVECHATGTQVGDATEVRSLGQVYTGLSGVPLGSLKSNLGHLITAAGMAGLLKVLGAMAAGTRPPTLAADDPNPALAGSPFRLLTAAEPWPEDGAPRRAALSAFGFGGNNAHLLVEEHRAEATGAVAVPAPVEAGASADEVPVAIVAAEVIAAGTDGTEDFARAAMSGTPRLEQRADGSAAGVARPVELPLKGLSFPPRDLEQTLPQQILLLRAAQRAVARLAGTLPRERTGVLVGMGCDAEVARWGLRWRLADWARGWGADADWLHRAGEAAVPGLLAAGVVGTMPNMPANRLNRQLDLGGASGSISSEELSGVVALELAARALADGELDAALVAAVDLSCEPVHEAAARALLPPSRHIPGDAAVALVLKRLDDARRDGDAVLAVLERDGEDDTPTTLRFALDGDGERASLTPTFGHAHAASGLLHVAAAALACHHRARPGERQARPWLAAAPRRAAVEVAAMEGQSAVVRLRQDDAAAPGSLPPAAGLPRLYTYAGADRREILARLEEGAPPSIPDGPARLVLVARDREELDCRRREAAAWLESGAAPRPSQRGIAFRERPLEGELGFVFTGAGAAYPGMGRELLLALPQLLDGLGRRVQDPAALAEWVYDPGHAGAPALSPLEQLWGCSFLCQAHAELSRRLLGLAPAAVLGYSSGESNALMALDAWTDLDALHRDTVECGLFSRALTGELTAVREAWQAGGHAGGTWAGWVLRAAPDRVREALAREERVHLTLISSPSEVVIGGEAEDCRKVIEALAVPAQPLGYDLAVHCPELVAVAEEWLELHRRPTREFTDVRFYTAAGGGRWYHPSREKAAQAILGQALTTVDFPAVVEKAWDDGVRVFLEHGPRGLCSGWIRETLRHRGVADDAYLALSLDRSGEGALLHTAETLAHLAAAGVELELGPFAGDPAALAEERDEGPTLTFDAHWPPVELPPLALPSTRKLTDLLETETVMTELGETQVMAPAPELPPVLGHAAPPQPAARPAPPPHEPAAPEPTAPEPTVEAPTPAIAAPAPAAGDPVAAAVLAGMSDLQTRLATAQKEYLDTQSRLHQQFLDLRRDTLDGLVRGWQAPPGAAPEPVAAPTADPTPPFEKGGPGGISPPTELPGPKLDRRDLEILASGKISSVFGPLFERQDGYARQVRMPEPPFLLADRVTGIDGEPGSMGLGTIWTETDVREDSWYLHRRRFPGGLMIEAGQADLLLISWLGVDFLNRGERVYRLLGCELTYRGPLPRPGDTLKYDIHVDGHAQQGDVRLFFFHYDCRIDSAVRLEVRHGQAGFFTDRELAESAGVLWDAAEAEPTGERLDPPAVRCAHRSFSREQLIAFSEGRVLDCFGAGFELAAAHTDTPRTQGGRLRLLDEITHLDPEGGPWGRGYLRAVTTIPADDWIFEGHFHGDPCMPGTVMFEGCLQTMSFYLAALGFTLERDGWRFEPVPDVPYPMRCRGQVIPTSRELVYELFVHEVVAGPEPTLWADLLCTVDGLKAFHAGRVGLRLVPDWPLESRPEIAAGLLAEAAPGRVAEAGGFAFGYASLLACAWGRPSAAFGDMYRPFDGPRTVARLPGPPYHFMSRIAAIDGEMGRFQPGAVIETEYDVPPEAWYFAENGCATMPYAVLLEAGLQPCGWLASFIGSALTADIDLQFRNLDGTGTLHREVLPDSGTLTNRVELLGTSSSGGVIIVRFRVEIRCAGKRVYDMETAFGFFPKAAMASQVGLPPSDAERSLAEAPSDVAIDLTEHPERTIGAAPRLAGGKLLMLDRITGYWPEGGEARRGRMRAEKDVDPSEWFFKAHFFQDPVQPGTLGIEAMLQLLQLYMLHTGMAEGLPAPRFEPIACGRPMTWKYRGQVLPTNHLITSELEIADTGRDAAGVWALAKAWLWVDGKRIYAAVDLGMRIVSGEGETMASPAGSAGVPPAPPKAAPESRRDACAPSKGLDPDTLGETRAELTLDPDHDTWLRDHCPTWTLPALPMMSILDLLATAARRRRPGAAVVGLDDVRLKRWIPFPGGAVRLETEVVGERRRRGGVQELDIELRVWRQASVPALSRFETAAAGKVLVAPSYPEPPAAPDPLAAGEEIDDPYVAGSLFHGPAFQLLRHLRRGAAGASALLDAAAGAVPEGVLHPGLLDAATHAIPHDELHLWSPETPRDVAAFPHRLEAARFFGPPPQTGEVRCEARLTAAGAQPRFLLQLVAEETLWAEIELVEVLLPKGRLGTAPPHQRRAFLRDRAAVAGLGLARVSGGQTRLTTAEVAASDWLPGTVARIYGTGPESRDRATLTRQVAIKDHVARRAGVHPASVAVELDPERPVAAFGVPAGQPLTRYPVTVVRLEGDGGEEVEVSDGGPPQLDVSPLRRYWSRHLEIKDWPVEDVYYGLIERFVRRVIVVDPDAMAALWGRPTLFLANHQVGVESLLFSMIASGLVGLPTVTLAKAEHKATWLGQLIAHCFSYPEVVDPEVITFFERDNIRSLPPIIHGLGERMRAGERSVMVHCEGTRSLSCRKPVEALSGSFVDMARKAGAAIVPVRFVGGLPAEPLERRIEFPSGFGQQDCWLGRPLPVAELAELRYRDRRAAVVAAINGLGPSNEEEEPYPGNPGFAAEVEGWIQDTGATPEHAALYKTLEKLESPGREVQRLIKAARAGELLLADTPADRWLGELARRLFGARGPRIVTGA